MLGRLGALHSGRLTIIDPQGAHTFEGQRPGPRAVLTVHDPGFYPAVVLGGTMGAAEAYCEGGFAERYIGAVPLVLATAGARHAPLLPRLG